MINLTIYHVTADWGSMLACGRVGTKNGSSDCHTSKKNVHTGNTYLENLKQKNNPILWYLMADLVSALFFTRSLSGQ